MATQLHAYMSTVRSGSLNVTTPTTLPVGWRGLPASGDEATRHSSTGVASHSLVSHTTTSCVRCQPHHMRQRVPREKQQTKHPAHAGPRRGRTLERTESVSLAMSDGSTWKEHCGITLFTLARTYDAWRRRWQRCVEA